MTWAVTWPAAVTAVAEAELSAFIHKVIPNRIISGYLEDRATEAMEYERNGKNHDYLIRRYFRFI